MQDKFLSVNGLTPATGSILFLASMFFISYTGRTITGPLLPLLEHDLGLSHSVAGGLFVYLFLGYLFSLLGSGFVSGAIGHRRTIVLSALGVGIALVFAAMSSSVWMLRIGLVAAGMASGLYLPSGISALTTLVKPVHWGRAIGIHDMAPNLSLVVAPGLAGMLLTWTTWRGVYLVFGIFAVLLGLTFVRFGPPVTGRGQVPNFETVKSLLRKPYLWIMCFLFSLGGAGIAGVYNMLPLFLTSEHGFEATSANLVVALTRMPGVGMVLIAGWATDFFGPREALGIVFACCGCLTGLIGNTSGPLLIIIIFIQSAVSVCFFPAGLAAVSKLFPFELRNIAIAITGACSGFVGSGVIAAFMGWMADLGMFGTGLLLNGAIVFAGLLFLPFLEFESDHMK